ncbi:MAG: M13 family metallopeptidase [bacterium]
MFNDAFMGTIRLRASGSALVQTVLALSLSTWPVCAARGQAPDDHRPSRLESSVDAHIKPGDDFFAYANGAWLKATEIPAGKERWGVRNELEELARQRVLKLLDDARAEPTGTLARKVADFRSAYQNEAAIEAKGLASLKPLLKRIDGVSDRASLARQLGSGMRADVDPLGVGIVKSSHLLGLSVGQSIHGEKTNVAFLVQGGLGLPDRKDYVASDTSAQALRARYQEYICGLLALAGFDRAEERGTAVMTLETALARSQATQEASAADHNADSVWTRADFAKRAPGMDWTAFFSAAGLAKQQEFVAWQPMAVTGAAALVASQPLSAWKDYLRLHAILDYVDVLPRAFGEKALPLRVMATGAQSRLAPRSERAVAATDAAMSGALGRLYSERYFPAEQKARVNVIVANVVRAFTKRVEATTWMSPATKTLALTKLKTLYVGIGYPDQWEDYSDLTVDPTDAVGNLQRVADRNYRRALAQLGKPVDLTRWYNAPQSVGGVLVFQQNAYEVTAALLEPPKYDRTASNAAAYGAVGALIGHDVTHYIDVLGADYDTEGRLRHWWNPDETKRFEALGAPLVSQFGAYQPLPGLAVNGKLTLTENIADLGGLAAAFDAYRHTLGSRATDKEYVRQCDREFFIAFAQTFRRKITDGAIRTQVATNDHGPEDSRVATVRNLDAWYDAFDVLPGQRLYLPPAERVRIW